MKKLTGLVSICALLALPGKMGAESLIMEANDKEGKVFMETEVSNDTRLRFASEGINVFDDLSLKTTIPFENLFSLTFRTQEGAGVALPVKSPLRLRENPVAESLVILGYEGEAGMLTIFNMGGNEVIRNQSWKGESVNVSHLTPGIYFVNVENATFKFIKK